MTQNFIWEVPESCLSSSSEIKDEEYDLEYVENPIKTLFCQRETTRPNLLKILTC